MEDISVELNIGDGGVKKCYVVFYLLTIGIGALIAGYCGGVFNSLMLDLMIVFNVK